MEDFQLRKNTLNWVSLNCF